MYLSADPVVLVPAGVVIWMSTTPAVWGGLVMVSWVADCAVSAVPAKVALVAPVRLGR